MKYIDLDALPSYTKLELATHQLDRAIKLLLDENDPISAITLAGAAEEILGKIIEQNGGTHALQGFINECVSIGRHNLNEDWKPKEFADMCNYLRNELKHYCEGSDITVTPECAHEIIDRAVENLTLLNGTQTEQVRRYFEYRWS